MRYSITIALAALMACGGERDPYGAAPDTDDVAAERLPFPFELTAEQATGRIVYDSLCRLCHGPAGRGDGTMKVIEGAQHPPDLTAAEYSRMTVGQLRERFLSAPDRPHDDEFRTSTGSEELAQALSYVTALSYPRELPGSALNGRELYGRYCMSCHGPEGDGNGPAAGLLVTRPTDLSRDTLVAKRDFDGLIRRTRNGPDGVHASSMPAWGLFFDDQMLWDVVTYLPAFRRDSDR